MTRKEAHNEWLKRQKKIALSIKPKDRVVLLNVLLNVTARNDRAVLAYTRFEFYDNRTDGKGMLQRSSSDSTVWSLDAPTILKWWGVSWAKIIRMSKVHK